MFIEETFEQWVIDRIATLKSSLGTEHFKRIERIGINEVTPENVEEFVKITPAAMIEISDDTVNQNLDSEGKSQMLKYTMRVHILTAGMWKKSALSDNANKLHRAVKNVMRGSVYGRSDGNENAASVYYAGRSIAKVPGSPLIIQTQTYTLTTYDTALP